MKKEILHYLRAKYFKIYSFKMFVGQKNSLIGAGSGPWAAYANRCYTNRFYFFRINPRIFIYLSINLYIFEFEINFRNQ